MTTRLKLLGAATLAVAAVSISGTASAAPTIRFNGTTGEFGNNTPTSRFTDTYNFDVARAGRVTINLFSFAINAATNVNFNSTTTAFNGRPLDEVSRGQFEFRQTIQQRVTAGTQTLVVDGASGPKGTYAGTISFAGVPEPAVWAFMILGFGAVGGAMRRRTKVTFRTA